MGKGCMSVAVSLTTVPWWLRWLSRLSTMQETRVRSLGREDPLEKRMKTHSSILVWRILWTEEPGGLQSMWSQASDMIEEPILLPSQHKC